jgi:hypothetical protein
MILSLTRNYKAIGTYETTAFYRWHEESLTRKLWTENNMHNIYFSHFDMIFTFLNHPKNNSIENEIIISELFTFLLKFRKKSIKVGINSLLRMLKIYKFTNNKKQYFQKFYLLIKSVIN